MNNAQWLRRAGWLGALTIAVAPTSRSWADDEPAKEAAPAAEAVAPQEPAAPREPEPPRPPRPPHLTGKMLTSKYVLKLKLSPLPKVLDQQLGLKGQGVLVGRVDAEGPAAKAGIQEDDIVLAVGDQPVKGPADLMKAVDASDGKEFSLKVLRAGKPVTVSVTPEKRAYGLIYDHVLPKHVDIDELRDLEHKIREKLEAAGVDMRMQFIQPGRFLPEGADFLFERRVELPDDLAVDIKKKGKEPAQIEVKKGDQSWTVAEDKLEELPDEVRMHVEGLLGRGPMRMKLMGDRHRRGGPPGDGPGPGAPHGPEDEFGPPPPGGPPGPPDRPGPRARRPGGPPHPEARDGGPDGPDDEFGPPPGPPDRPGPRARRPGGPPHPEARDGGPDGPPRGPEGERGPRGFRPPRPGGPDGPDGPDEHDRGPHGRGGLERRLDELSHDFDRLRSRIEALREGLREEPDDE